MQYQDIVVKYLIPRSFQIIKPALAASKIGGIRAAHWAINYAQYF